MGFMFHLWGEALSSAVYLINRTPSSVLGFRRPLDVLSKHCTLPSIVHLAPLVFGCVVYVHLHTNQRTKLEPRALKCVFVGYGSTQKGYWCYHPLTKKFYVSMDVIFHEKMFFYPTGITNCSLEGESRDEVQNQDEIRFFEIMRPSSIEVETADTSSFECSIDSNIDQVHDSTLSPTSTNPLTQSSPKDSLEVLPDPIPVDSNIHDIVSITEPASEPSQYHLPPRSNRGQPATRYKLGPKSKAKYPISNHVSSHKLSESYASYVLQLSSISIPSKLQEVVAYSRWTKAMAK